MTPVTLTAFVAQSGGSATGPGAGTNNLNLQIVRAPNSVAKGPNDGHFVDPTKGAMMLQLNDITDGILADLPKGKTVQIIIQDVPVTITNGPATT